MQAQFSITSTETIALDFLNSGLYEEALSERVTFFTFEVCEIQREGNFKFYYVRGVTKIVNRELRGCKNWAKITTEKIVFQAVPNNWFKERVFAYRWLIFWCMWKRWSLPSPPTPGHWTSFSTTLLTLFSIASPCRVCPVAPRELHAQLSIEETSHYILKGFFVGACQYKSFEYQNTTFHDFSTYAKSEWLHVMSKAIKSLCFSQVTSLVVGFVHTPITKQHFDTPFPGPLERKSRPFCNDMANLWPLHRAWLRIFSVYFTKL